MCYLSMVSTFYICNYHNKLFDKKVLIEYGTQITKNKNCAQSLFKIKTNINCLT